MNSSNSAINRHSSVKIIFGNFTPHFFHIKISSHLILHTTPGFSLVKKKEKPRSKHADTKIGIKAKDYYGIRSRCDYKFGSKSITLPPCKIGNRGKFWRQTVGTIFPIFEVKLKCKNAYIIILEKVFVLNAMVEREEVHLHQQLLSVLRIIQSWNRINEHFPNTSSPTFLSWFLSQ